MDVAARQPVSPISTADAAVQCALDTDSSRLSVSDLELLLHFTAHTGPSLVAPDDLNHPVSRFWAHDAPRIGLSYPFIMKLILSLAARHLAHSEPENRDRRLQLVSLAHHHLTDGVAEASRFLASLDATNCGALYLSSLLVCFSSFAAGPSGPRDLLICHMSDSSLRSESSEPWMPLIRGVRLIRDAYPPEALFSGLMAGLVSEKEDPAAFRPSFITENFERIDWIPALEEIRSLVKACDDQLAPARLEAFNLLASIYEATYGRDEAGSCDVASVFRFLFIWIYQIKDDFIIGLQGRDSVCLLILAYWALLLRTYSQYWFMDGWTVHLLKAVRDVLDQGFVRWLGWPLAIAGVGIDQNRLDPQHWDVANR
ncbi:hypothetical protein ACJ41O_008622 [Fusarium nematophilum]